MSRFLANTFLLALAIQIIVFWVLLINEKQFNSIEYKQWMLIILFIGCSLATVWVMNILNGTKNKD
jgi:hypothetical protein